MLFIFLAELASFFVSWMKIVINLETYFFAAIVLLVALASIKNIKYGLYAALAELFIGSQGHLFELKISGYEMSIRIAIFFVVILVWFVKVLIDKQFSKVWPELKSYPWLAALGAVSLWGLIFALQRGNSWSNIFFDFNAWIYFLYIFPLVSVFNKNDLPDILQIFSAGITALAIKTLLFLYVFSHQFSFLRDFYRWGRDTLWGEFTIINENFYRIFSQGQIFILIGFFIFLSVIFFNHDLKIKNIVKNRLLYVGSFLLLTLVISLSRSFWLALVLTIIVFIVVFFKQANKKFSSLLIGILLILSGSFIIFNAIIYFPWPKPTGQFDASSLVEARLSLTGAGISSRWSQLPNLTKAIIKHPILGSGWGATVTYQSTDPRILTESNPEGRYSTYAFEWGYLDIILKIGLLGLIVYLLFIWSIAKQCFQLIKKNIDRGERALAIGFLLGLLALLIVHGFSPYLNHPLGIGYLLLIMIFAGLINREENQQISGGH